MPARRNINKKRPVGKPRIPDSAKPGPDEVKKLLNSKYKLYQVAGLKAIGEDIDKLSHFAKTSKQEDVRRMCIVKLIAFKTKGSERAKEALRDIAENAEYEDARTCASNH